MGYAAGIEELPGLKAVVGCLYLGGLVVVGMAEYRLQLLDRAVITFGSLFIGRRNQPFAPGDLGVGAFHRFAGWLRVAAVRDSLPPPLQPAFPAPIQLLRAVQVEAHL